MRQLRPTRSPTEPRPTQAPPTSPTSPTRWARLGHGASPTRWARLGHGASPTRWARLGHGASPTRWPLRRRLVAVVIALLATVGLVTGVVSALALRDSLVAQLDERLAEANARGFRAVPPEALRPLDSDRPTGLVVPGQSAGTVRVEQIGNEFVAAYIADDGALVDLSREQGLALLEVPTDRRPRTVEVQDLGRYRVVAVPVDGGAFVTGLPLAEVDATIARHVATTVATTLAGVLLVGVLGTVLVRRELRPLERVAATARRVAHQPLHEGEVRLADRVDDADTDPTTEVGQVGAALDQLLGHVEEALAARHVSETRIRQFVADASHELRTPLASIRGYAELVRRTSDDVPPDVLRAMDRVESESRRMTALVEDLLTLARLDTGRALERTPVDLASLAADAVADAHVAGPDHRWVLELPPPADEGSDALVLGDEHALRQVLVNLLANARVHTPPGTTTITAVAVEPGRAGVSLTVTDDGPGVPPELQTRIFDRFARADPARSTGGTGLGLAIADAVVRAHHGTIAVESRPGRTVFRVTLPAHRPTTTPRGH